MVTLYNLLEYRKRHGGKYKQWMEYYRSAQHLSRSELEERQAEFLRDFVNYARQHSLYYKRLFQKIGLPDNWSMNDFYTIPVLSKEDIYKNGQEIFTISAKDGWPAKTGGTTGMSLQVIYHLNDLQKRFAMLDLFRAKYGYTLGEKAAWFNGKDILTKHDLKHNRYWKYDWLHKIRYYSTFHINAGTVRHYIDDLNRFRPMYIVGYPSCIYEVAKCAMAQNYKLHYRVKAIFPTSETLLEEHRRVAEPFFGCRMVDQYASAEGAPFIIECERGRLHLELLSGFFEVVDEHGRPAQEGELLVTSFSTHGTPLIRYAIKDYVTLSDESCDCGNANPLVKRIEGRTNEYIISSERGRINQINIINCARAVNGVVKFQVTQLVKDEIAVKIVKNDSYTLNDEQVFLQELRHRLGRNVKITFKYVEDIQREKSGKYRVVKQEILD
jgi:phenylacetate-CoA ligase